MPRLRGEIIAGLTVIFITSVSSIEYGLEKHNCSRPCTSGTGPKRCSYSFFVEEVPVTARSCSNLADVKNGQNTTCSEMFSDKSNLVINGRSPGPAIEVCLGDTVEIFVYNKLKAMEVSFHWHGIIQKGSTHMDGVAMITQCPILPYSAFRYAMKLETPGTYFYYAHAAPQQGDGLYGSLVVRKPDDNPSLEKTLMFSARSSTPLTHFSILNPQPIELLVNGQTGDKETVLNSGRRYKLRLINANVFNCPISFSIAKHHLEVVAIDASPLQKITSASHVIMFPVPVKYKPVENENIDVFHKNKLTVLLATINPKEDDLKEEYIVSDIDPESIAFVECSDETNGSITESFNASLSEDAEESSSSLKVERFNGQVTDHFNSQLMEHNSFLGLDESGQMTLDSESPDRTKTKEEFLKFGESVAVQLAEIPDSYSRAVAKLRINQILFEAEIGAYAQTRR